MNKKSPFYTVFFVTMICLVFGLGISIVHNLTYDMLKNNEVLHKNKVLCNAFMINIDDDRKSYQKLVEEKLDIKQISVGKNSRQFYKLVGSEEKTIGFSFIGMGFWDYISGIVVLSQDLQEIINIQFLEQKETPGLGGRILEEGFTNQFKGLNIAWDKPTPERIVIKPASESHEKNKVDSITGATQTSNALNRILNNELEEIRQFILSKQLNNKQEL